MSWFLERMRLDGETLDARVESAVVAGEHLRAMKGASTVEITIHDPDRELFRSGVLVKKRRKERRNEPIRPASNLRIGETRLALDGDPYLLASYGKTGSNLVLRFEHEITALMRRHTKPRKASRSTYSRAQFILHFLVRPIRERHIFTDFRSFKAQPAYAPGDNPDTKRKVEKLNQRKLQDPSVRIDDQSPDSTQRHNINLVLQAIADQAANKRAALALIEACLVEAPNFANPIGGDGTSSGILQLTDDKLGGSTSTRGGRRDVYKVASEFLSGKGSYAGHVGAIPASLQNPTWNPGEIAQRCQGSAYPERYEKRRTEAEAILAGGGGTGVSGTSVTIDVPTRYIFHVGSLNGQREDYWEGGTRLAEEVNANFFVANGVLTYGFDRDFFTRPPVAMVAEVPTGRQHDMGVQHVGNIDFEQFVRHAVEEVHFTARADQFFAFPGATIEIVDPNLGPAVGKYLISEIRDTLGSLDVDITCTRPTAQRKEPAAPTTSITIPTQYGAQQSRGTSRKLVYPLPVHGTNLGGVAAHNANPGKPNTLWQSVNAVDIGVPRGTRVFAVDDGTILKLGGSWNGGQSRTDGFSVTIRTETNEWYYTHMMSHAPGLQENQSISRGDPVGVSGAGGGTDHLHIASLRGDPEALLGV